MANQSQATSAILWFHGNAGNISTGSKTKFLFDRGLSLFMPDYRGYGRARHSFVGIYVDGQASYDYLVRCGVAET
jgi:hypothetical protein